MPNIRTRLSTKIMLMAVVFLSILAMATAFLLVVGFQRTERTATNQSIVGLQAQGKANLLALVSREARIISLYFQEPEQASRVAVNYLQAQQRSVSLSTPSAEDLTERLDGSFSNFDSNRVSDLFLANAVSPTASTSQRAIRLSASLDTLAPTMLNEHTQVVAMYYASRHNVVRYYPAGAFEGYVPADWQAIDEPWFELTAPSANPDRTTTWSSPYLDDFGNGLIVTTCSPFYEDTTFEGMVCLDVTLRQIVDELHQLQTTASSYAFLTNSNGYMIIGSPTAVQELTGYSVIPLPEDNNITIGLPLEQAAIQAAMQAGEQQVRTMELHGQQVFLSIAPVPGIDWRLGIVTPVDEVTAQAATVAAAVQTGTRLTLQSALLTMGAFLLVALFGILLFSYRLTRPITALVKATEHMAAGSLDTRVMPRSLDEIGLLGHSFNSMAESLQVQTAAEQTAQAERLQIQEDMLHLQEEQLRELSTPIIPLLARVILMPIIGTVSDRRADQMLEVALQGVRRYHAKTLLLDFSGVPAVDTQAGRIIGELAQGVRLLGAEVVLIGIGPHVSQELANLDTDLSALRTYADLQQAVLTTTRVSQQKKSTTRISQQKISTYQH